MTLMPDLLIILSIALVVLAGALFLTMSASMAVIITGGVLVLLVVLVIISGFILEYRGKKRRAELLRADLEEQRTISRLFEQVPGCALRFSERSDRFMVLIAGDTYTAPPLIQRWNSRDQAEAIVRHMHASLGAKETLAIPSPEATGA